jgi:hypothetical protein
MEHPLYRDEILAAIVEVENNYRVENNLHHEWIYCKVHAKMKGSMEEDERVVGWEPFSFSLRHRGIGCRRLVVVEAEDECYFLERLDV